MASATTAAPTTLQLVRESLAELTGDDQQDEGTFAGLACLFAGPIACLSDSARDLESQVNFLTEAITAIQWQLGRRYSARLNGQLDLCHWLLQVRAAQLSRARYREFFRNPKAHRHQLVLLFLHDQGIASPAQLAALVNTTAAGIEPVMSDLARMHLVHRFGRGWRLTSTGHVYVMEEFLK